MSESLWVIPEISAVPTPLSILREQANLLTKQTRGLLRGEVVTRVIERFIYISLRISVPALEDYAVEILTYEQEAKPYPGTLRSSFAEPKTDFPIKDESQFLDAFKKVIASRPAQDLVAALLAQARAN